MSKKKHAIEKQLRKDFRLEGESIFHKFEKYKDSVWTTLNPNLSCFQEEGLYLYTVIKLSDLMNPKSTLYTKMGHATLPVQNTIGNTPHDRYSLRDITIIVDVITVTNEILIKHQTDSVIKLEEKIRRELDFVQNSSYNGREWWKNKSAFELIEEMKLYLFGSRKKSTFSPRYRQREVINKIVSAINAGYKEFLFGALMRFGKNFSVLWALTEVLKTKPTKRILYWTFKPGVFNSLEDDINNHIKFEEYSFILLKDSKTLNNLPENVVVAASRQLVEHKNNYPLLNEVLSMSWDAIVIDECHAGIETFKGQNVLDFFRGSEIPIIYMSGTPQKQIGKIEFCDENTYLYDETNQLKDKESGLWDDAIILETHLIKLNNKNFGEVQKYIGTDGLFNFTKFFGYNNKIKRFNYDSDLRMFIKDFWGLNPFTRNIRNFFGGYEHIFILVAWDSDMIIHLAKLFQEVLGPEYTVLGATKGFKKAKLTNAIKQGKKTITLACNMLIEGETVPEWVCTINMSDTPSLFKYRQFSFRPTSPNPKNPNKRAFFYDLNPETHFNLTYERFKSDGVSSLVAEQLTREYYENHNIFYGDTCINWSQVNFDSLKVDSIRSRNLVNSITYHIDWNNLQALNLIQSSDSEIDVTTDYGDTHLKLNSNDMEGGKTFLTLSPNEKSKSKSEDDMKEIRAKLSTVLSRFPYVMFLEKEHLSKISVESVLESFDDKIFEGAFGMNRQLFRKIWNQNGFIDRDELNYYFGNLVKCSF